jgi:hypothetical protein
MIRLIESIINAIANPLRQLYLWFLQCLPGIHFIKRFSLPAKWAMLSFLFLLLIWAGVLVKIWTYSESNRPDDWFIYGVIPCLLLVVIPALVYWFVKVWLQEEPSKYPEIDRVWFEGIGQAKEKGIPLDRTPLFLVLGTANGRTNTEIMEMIGHELPVQISDNDGPVSFFASAQAIWVFAQGCCAASRLSQVPGTSVATKLSTNGGETKFNATRSPEGGTIDASFFEQSSGSNFSKAPVSPVDSGIVGGTMLLFDDNMDVASILPTAVTFSRQLTSKDHAECEDKLGYLCSLIRKSRNPDVPINGMLAAIPFELVESSSAALQTTIQKDMVVLRDELQVRAPCTVVITGMEQDPGFIELIKRLGPTYASDHRFGKGVDLWASPDAVRLGATAVHATAAFEDWIYTLFQNESALKQKRNSRLFGLLCRVRGTFTENLKGVLAQGFGFNPLTDPQLSKEQFLFAGCYFAATGSTTNEQAYVKSVLARVMQNEGELDWAPSAREADARYQLLANLVLLVGLAAVISIGVMGYIYWKKSTEPATLTQTTTMQSNGL